MKSNQVFVFQTKFRKDNGRVILEALEENTCKVTIEPIEPKDEGMWKFSLRSGSGKNQKIAYYFHNVSVSTVG